MCGRYASFREAQALADAFDVEEISQAAQSLPASYNVAPTEDVRIVVDRLPKTAHTSSAAGSSASSSSGERSATADSLGATQVQRELHVARWGLVPPWAPDLSIGARMFNAREDSLATKRSFAPSLRARRCLVVADGYYEWLKEEVPGQSKPRRTPFYIHRTDAAPLAFAGLYAWWPDPAKEKGDPQRWVLSTTIVTTQAHGGLERIHHREPLVVDEAAGRRWLDPRVTDEQEALAALSRPGPPMSWHEVSARVGSVRNNDAGLIEPV